MVEILVGLVVEVVYKLCEHLIVELFIVEVCVDALVELTPRIVDEA